MKINITKKEYVKLLDVFYIADWILHGFESDREDTKEYRDLEQKFLAYAKDDGVDDLVDEDIEDGQFYPTRKFEDESPAMGFIKEYEENSFWDELTERLAIRDLVKKHGPESLKAIFENEVMFNEFEDLKEKYALEFEEHGIEKLCLLREG